MLKRTFYIKLSIQARHKDELKVRSHQRNVECAHDNDEKVLTLLNRFTPILVGHLKSHYDLSSLIYCKAFVSIREKTEQDGFSISNYSNRETYKLIDNNWFIESDLDNVSDKIIDDHFKEHHKQQGV